MKSPTTGLVSIRPSDTQPKSLGLRMDWEERKKMYNAEYLDRQGKFPVASNIYAIHVRIRDELNGLFSPRRVLDCGCGYGWLSGAFSEIGVEVYGIDFNPSAIEQARKNYPQTPFICKDIVDGLDFDDNYFDLVVAKELIEHIDDEYFFHVIGEIARVTKRWLYWETPTIISNPTRMDTITEYNNWLLAHSHLSLPELIDLVGRVPELQPEYARPENREHPNTHPRRFWVDLFKLIGFEERVFAESQVALRYDGIPGLCLMFFERK